MNETKNESLSPFVSALRLYSAKTMPIVGMATLLPILNTKLMKKVDKRPV